LGGGFLNGERSRGGLTRGGTGGPETCKKNHETKIRSEKLMGKGARINKPLQSLGGGRRGGVFGPKNPQQHKGLVDEVGGVERRGGRLAVTR